MKSAEQESEDFAKKYALTFSQEIELLAYTKSILSDAIASRDEEVARLKEELRISKVNAESWESACRVSAESKLPCGHPNNFGYDKNGDGRYANIGCVGCERDSLRTQLQQQDALICQKDEALMRIVAIETVNARRDAIESALSPILTSTYVPKEVADKLVDTAKALRSRMGQHDGCSRYGVVDSNLMFKFDEALTAYQSTQQPK